MSVQTILLPITNTIDTDALLYAQEVCLSKKAKLIVLYITSPLSFTSCYSYPSILYSVANLSMDSIETAHEALKNKINTILEDCNHEVICLIGPQLDTILSVAKENNVDLIILPEEHTLLDKLTHNSHKDKLSKKCDIPIITYPVQKQA